MAVIVRKCLLVNFSINSFLSIDLCLEEVKAAMAMCYFTQSFHEKKRCFAEILDDNIANRGF